MPVYCDIFPELNLIVYVCVDTVIPVEFFRAGDVIALDPRLKEKMKIIIDFHSAELETSVSDLHLAIQKHREAKLRGHEVGQAAVLTTSMALHYLGDAIKLLSFDSVSNFGIFHHERDVISWLDLPEAEALTAWEKVREIASNSKSG